VSLLRPPSGFIHRLPLASVKRGHKAMQPLGTGGQAQRQSFSMEMFSHPG
jgi:hypothetical protein